MLDSLCSISVESIVPPDHHYFFQCEYVTPKTFSQSETVALLIENANLCKSCRVHNVMVIYYNLLHLFALTEQAVRVQLQVVIKLTLQS